MPVNKEYYPVQPQIDSKFLGDAFDWRNIPPVDRLTSNIAPDRLCVEPGSEYYCPIYIRRVGVKLDGVILSRVIEYCVSEGWVREYRPSRPGKARVKVSTTGRVVAFKRSGKVRAYLEGPLEAIGDGTFELVREDGSRKPVGVVSTEMDPTSGAEGATGGGEA
jgi:hypothetical protein